MPRGKKKEVKKDVKVEVKVEEPVVTEKDQLLARHAELSRVHQFLQTNKLNDIGQVEVTLARINQRLTEL